MIIKTFTIEKPWGKFQQFTHNENSTVKIIFVNSGNSLSLQTHTNRSEYWYIISGHPSVTIGEIVKNANPGEEFNINKNEVHRLEAQNDNVQILEISYGNFDEEDIIRLDDKYDRT